MDGAQHRREVGDVNEAELAGGTVKGPGPDRRQDLRVTDEVGDLSDGRERVRPGQADHRFRTVYADDMACTCLG